MNWLHLYMMVVHTRVFGTILFMRPQFSPINYFQFFLLIVTVLSCSTESVNQDLSQSKKNQQSEIERVPVETIKPEKRTLNQVISTVAIVEAKEQVTR